MFMQEKQHWFTLTMAALVSISLLGGCKQKDKEESGFDQEEIRKISETMGHFVVENLKAQNVTLDIESFIRGIENAKAGKSPPLTREEFSNLFMQYRKKALDLQSAENLKIAEDFLEDNKQEEGVVSLEARKLQYKILSPGSGEVVGEENVPLIHYEGKYLDGKVFDSTYSRGQPMPLSLKTTIPGFKKGVEGMKKGEKRRLFIHPELGYGTSGRLQPNALLIFDIELIEVETKKPELLE